MFESDLLCFITFEKLWRVINERKREKSSKYENYIITKTTLFYLNSFLNCHFACFAFSKYCQFQIKTKIIIVKVFFLLEWIEKPGNTVKNQVTIAKKHSKYDPYVNLFEYQCTFFKNYGTQ